MFRATKSARIPRPMCEQPNAYILATLYCEVGRTQATNDKGVLSGYANEVGEAFRPLVHRFWVRLSYGVAFGYVLADTAHKTSSASDREHTKDIYNRNNVVIAAADTLLWQTLASIAIPGFTINRLCALSLYALKKSSKLSPTVVKWTTTGIGLACIPFIVTPIDRGVDHMLDATVRKWLHIPQHSQPTLPP